MYKATAEPKPISWFSHTGGNGQVERQCYKLVVGILHYKLQNPLGRLENQVVEVGILDEAKQNHRPGERDPEFWYLGEPVEILKVWTWLGNHEQAVIEDM